MSKVRPLRPESVAAAREVLAAADVRTRRDVVLPHIAVRMGAVLLYQPAHTAKGGILRAGRAAVIAIDETAKGTPRESFIAAHELGHLAMHSAADHFKQCDEEPEARERRFWAIEEQASHFSVELLMHEPFARPYCTAARPALHDVATFATAFGTSLHASGIRYVQLTDAACALVKVALDGRIARSSETHAFPGRIVQRRAVHPQSLAARVLKKRPGAELGPREVPGEAWGGEKPFIEHAIHMGMFGVLSWITPA